LKFLSLKNCSDFGTNNDTDICCQAHDYCPWTFSKHNRSYNGFKSSNRYFTLSHCECDIKFYECLLDSPYKRGSNLIFSTYFDTYRAKCFAYLPCDDRIFGAIDKRHTGKCYKNLRVIEFNSIEDYTNYIKSNVKNELVLALRDLMLTADNLMTERKKAAPCRSKFANYTNELIDNLSKRFYKSEHHPLHLVFAPMVAAVNVSNVTDQLMSAVGGSPTEQVISSSYEDDTSALASAAADLLPKLDQTSAPKRVMNFFKALYKNIVKSDDESDK